MRSCWHLGAITLNGVPKGPRGTVQIDLAMEIDLEEVLTVTLNEPSTSNHARVVLPTKNTPEQRRSQLAAQRTATDAQQEKEKPPPKKGLLSRLLGR